MIFRNDYAFNILEIKGLSILKQEGSLLFFEDGTYNQATGETIYVKKELPFLLDKMTQLHKATTNSPIYWLNIFFGVSLLFLLYLFFGCFYRILLYLKKEYILLTRVL